MFGRRAIGRSGPGDVRGYPDIGIAAPSVGVDMADTAMATHTPTAMATAVGNIPIGVMAAGVTAAANMGAANTVAATAGTAERRPRL